MIILFQSIRMCFRLMLGDDMEFDFDMIIAKV